MAFWLARERRGQQSAYIQRFDPRFWTVDFPRPAMASATVPAPDSLQVDCEFHHEGELVGLIWESEDRHDHPLLAYTTSRDYSRTSLTFRWQSSGLIPLDQVNGPTLTIEGRDAAGAPKSWFVRLWNYASGTPTDALIDIRFSDLEGGWFLPGDPVNALDIDRMFISLVPPGYVAGSTARLAQRANGRATISQINCDGDKAMLEIGDIMLPPHGERIATAYDDAYNHTPDRVLRNLFRLGYREELIHYVGMSHFMRLADDGAGALHVTQPAQLCEPAVQWHQSYFAKCRDFALTPIASLSYELFDQYCPTDWKQRAFDGEPAQTGWVPPSTLLSPANASAMAWLHQAAALFVQMLESAQQPAKFQIGEPWWWVTSSGKPCIYDAAATALYGANPPTITDMRAATDAAANALLDQAGSLLAQSTAALKQAVIDAASGSAEVRLLIFTPTILDPDMPEMPRLNLPAGWAYPAFDRLQVEDYDWLTQGAAALRRKGYAEVDARLAYPIGLQDYLSGFALLAENAETMWPLIDRGLDEAAERGVARRFVWALPQITRDGYTRLPQTAEDDMQAFDEVHYPFALGRSAAVSPEFSTSVVVTTSGHERRNSLWSDARMHFDVGPGIRSEDELADLVAFFRARRGAARGFLITDPLDFSSNEMAGPVTPGDQVIGVGDGVISTFQLIKNYGENDPQVRPISRPREQTVRVSIDGTEAFNWTLQSGGWVQFDAAPSAGAQVRAGFLFDVPVRFAQDRIDISGFNFAAGEAPSIPLVEIRESQ